VAEEIGGFWASLTLKSDESAFAKGERALQGIATGLGKIVGFGVGLASAMVGFTALMGKINQTQATMNITAAEAGVSTDALANWSIVMQTVGADTEGFIAALKDLKNMTADLARGITPSNQKFVDMFGQLGITQKQWQGMDPGTLAQTILDNAVRQIKSGKNRNTIANAVANLLGEGGRTLLFSELLTGQSTAGYQRRAAQAMMTTESERLAAMGPAQDLNLFRSTIAEAKNLFAMKFMAAVDPALQKLLEYMVEHKKEISDTISEWAKNFGDLVTNAGPLIDLIGKLAGFAMLGAQGAELLASLVTGKATEGQAVGFGERAAKFMLPKEYQKSVDRFYRMHGGVPEPWEVAPAGSAGAAGRPQNPPPLRLEVTDKTAAGIKVKDVGSVGNTVQQLTQ
jgi:hypothetical protein